MWWNSVESSLLTTIFILFLIHRKVPPLLPKKKRLHAFFLHTTQDGTATILLCKTHLSVFCLLLNGQMWLKQQKNWMKRSYIPKCNTTNSWRYLKADPQNIFFCHAEIFFLAFFFFALLEQVLRSLSVNPSKFNCSLTSTSTTLLERSGWQPQELLPILLRSSGVWGRLFLMVCIFDAQCRTSSSGSEPLALCGRFVRIKTHPTEDVSRVHCVCSGHRKTSAKLFSTLWQRKVERKCH